MRSALATAPKPPCANSQPKPRPAASPARGANQRPGPDGCGAVAGCCCVGGVACLGGPVTSAATEPGGLDIICQDARTEDQREQGNDQFFHGLSPRFRICVPDARP